MRELIINGEKTAYDLKKGKDGDLIIEIGGESFNIKDWKKTTTQAGLRVNVNGKNLTLWRAGEWASFCDTLVQVKSTRASTRNKGASVEEGAMASPMPGKILKVMAEAGQSVEVGEGLLVMEAMKMEHTIKANANGVVSAVHCSEGDLVDGGVELVSIESSED